MKFELLRIEDEGDLNRERIVLKAVVPLADLGNYAIFAAKESKDGDAPLAGDLPAAYWFADQIVNEGDLIVLYTKAGRKSEKVGDSGRKSYFYYWGKSQPCWKRGIKAILLESRSWESLK